jgi:group II intron reverse transcriptase/maturase
VETKLNLITEKAREDKKCRFNNLAHLLNMENLQECFYLLKADKACGIDKVTMEEYGKNIAGNIEELIKQMKRQAYKPQAVRRTYIPKANGKKRPLGIPTVEDKMVQMCIARILNAIYEPDFIEKSYGFRPGKNCHMALDAVDKIIMTKPVNHIIDADIKGFFDNVNHEWLMKCLEQRISDFNMLRLIKRFLIAGYVEDGQFHKTDKGTPQGGVISPILANIYLHYVLDLWLEKIIKKQSRGYVDMVRYADDYIIFVQYKEEVQNIPESLKKRFEKFGLELSEEKTKIIEFGRFAEENAKKKGKKPETFGFLGFTHFCDKSRKGKFKVGRKTDKKKFSAKIKEMNIWLKSVRNLCRVREWWPTLCAKLRGHFQYFGVSGNHRGINKFFFLTIRHVFKWMNRRSQKKSFNWTTFVKYIQRVGIPKPVIHHNLYTLYGY